MRDERHDRDPGGDDEDQRKDYCCLFYDFGRLSHYGEEYRASGERGPHVVTASLMSDRKIERRLRGLAIGALLRVDRESPFARSSDHENSDRTELRTALVASLALRLWASL